MKKKTKLIMIAAGAAALVMAAGYTVFIAPRLEQDTWVYKEDTVQRGTLTVGVTESGSLEYGITSVLYDLDLTVTASDDDDDDDDDSEETIQKYLKIETMNVVSGQRVQAGDALVTFTQDSVADVRKLLNSALIDARSDYNEAKAEYELSALEAGTDYEILKIQEKYAATIYKAADSSISDSIASMEIELTKCNNQTADLQEAVTEAQEDYAEALETYEAAKETMSLTGTGNVPNYLVIQTEYQNAQTQYQNAQRALEQAQKKVKENEEQIASLTSQIAAARAKYEIDKLDTLQSYRESVLNGENAQIAYNAQLESLKEDLAEAEEEKAQIEEQLEAFEAFVGEDGILYADEEGIITQVQYEDGDTLEQNGIILAYATPDDMTITVDMTQEDVVALTVGDTVEIAFTAYPDDIYEGTILSIDTTATSRNSSTISYQVVIGVGGDTTALYGGMTADITFVTEEKEDVCYVSRKAIVEQDGKTYVYVKEGLSGRELKQVETGISNGIYIEIVSGLEEGDTIYIASKVSSEAEIEAQNEEASSSDGADSFSGMELPDGVDFGDMPDGFDSGNMPGMGSGDMKGGMGSGQMPGGMGSGQMPGGNSGR